MNSKKRKVIAWTLVILWMAVIFMFSQMGHDASGNSSRNVLGRVVSVFVHENAEETTEVLHVPFRKFCHLGEYFILAILVFYLLSLYNIRLKQVYIITLMWCFIYACSDEIHQIFIAGRGPRFFDVCVDTCGSVLYLSFRLLLLDKKKKKRK